MNTIRRIVELAKVKTFAFKCIAIGAALALVASACVIQLASTQLIGGRQTAQAAMTTPVITATKLTANPWALPERRPWADCWPKSWI